jgi:hypothetical protein
LETYVIFTMLLGRGVPFARFHQTNIGRGERTAISIARPFPSAHLSNVTSPGRRPVVFPRIPFFSMTGESCASVPILSTRLRSELCRIMISPDFVQQVA